MSFTPLDAEYMGRALTLARRGIYTSHPNPRVGCVLVRDKSIVGEGFHVRAGEPHAEVVALQQAGMLAHGATAYVTLEPCSHKGRTPPCTEALIDYGISRVIAAMPDPNPVARGGFDRLKAAGIEVASGLLRNSAETLNPGFINRMTCGLPWIRVKSAMSLDARTALVSGESRWITGDPARRDVQYWRARADAVLTGVETILADDPSLNVRLDASDLGIETDVSQPLRVVLDSHLRMPPDARLFDLPGRILVIAAKECVSERNRVALESSGAEVTLIGLAGTGRGLDLEEVMKLLAQRNINEVHVEAGATVSGALTREKLVDEFVFYIAPHLLGGNARNVLVLPTIESMSERLELNIIQVRRVGDDWRVIARPN